MRGLRRYRFRVGDELLEVLSYPSDGLGPPPSGVTISEWDVVRLVLAGMSNREIAQARGTSDKTVANQLRAVYGKLGCNSRGELAARLLDDDRGKRAP